MKGSEFTIDVDVQKGLEGSAAETEGARTAHCAVDGQSEEDSLHIMTKPPLK